MQRYLQQYTLERNGLANFDSWAATFGETVTAIELAPEGTGYRTKTRFARFFNLPELMAMFKECADIQTADNPVVFLPTPHGLLPMKCTPEQYEQFQRDGNKLKIKPIDHGER